MQDFSYKCSRRPFALKKALFHGAVKSYSEVLKVGRKSQNGICFYENGYGPTLLLRTNIPSAMNIFVLEMILLE